MCCASAKLHSNQQRDRLSKLKADNDSIKNVFNKIAQQYFYLIDIGTKMTGVLYIPLIITILILFWFWST